MCVGCICIVVIMIAMMSVRSFLFMCLTLLKYILDSPVCYTHGSWDKLVAGTYDGNVLVWRL